MYSNARERNLLELAVSAPRFQHYRDAQTIFDGFAAENVFAFTLTGLGDPVQIFGGRVTANYFDVPGVRPVRGRNFLPEEHESADVAIGKTVLYSSSSIPAEIIGVVGDVRSRKVAEPDDVEVLTATALMPVSCPHVAPHWSIQCKHCARNKMGRKIIIDLYILAAYMS